jgi:cellulose synthase/poly-beta-1,6-N-acetylglucosamine synthase-like glycosyltransferase
VIHGDCIVHKKFLRKALENFKNNPEVGVICASTYLPIETWKEYNYYDKVAHYRDTVEFKNSRKMVADSKIVFALRSGGKSTIFRRSLLEEIGNFNAKKYRTAGEDGDLTYRIAETKWKILMINYPTFHLHAINKTDLKAQFKKVIRLNEAKGVLFRTYGLKAMKTVTRGRYWNILSMTLLYFITIVGLILEIFINNFFIFLGFLGLFGIIVIELFVYTIKMGIIIPGWKVITLPFIKFVKNILGIYGFWKGFIINRQTT